MRLEAIPTNYTADAGHAERVAQATAARRRGRWRPRHGRLVAGHAHPLRVVRDRHRQLVRAQAASSAPGGCGRTRRRGTLQSVLRRRRRAPPPRSRPRRASMPARTPAPTTSRSGAERGTVLHAAQPDRHTRSEAPGPDDTIESSTLRGGHARREDDRGGPAVLLRPRRKLVPAINARARVSHRQVTTRSGNLPIAAPDNNVAARRSSVHRRGQSWRCRCWDPLSCSQAVRLMGLGMMVKQHPHAGVAQLVPATCATSACESCSAETPPRLAASYSSSATTRRGPQAGLHISAGGTWAASGAEPAPPSRARSVSLFQPGRRALTPLSSRTRHRATRSACVPWSIRRARSAGS